MKKILFIFFVLSITSCTIDNEEEYFTNLECDSENIYYNAIDDNRSISSIVANKCLSCHDLSSSIPLNYTMLYYYNLIDIINGVDPHVPQMPPLSSPQLTDCEKLKIESWVLNNMPENE